MLQENTCSLQRHVLAPHPFFATQISFQGGARSISGPCFDTQTAVLKRLAPRVLLLSVSETADPPLPPWPPMRPGHVSLCSRGSRNETGTGVSELRLGSTGCSEGARRRCFRVFWSCAFGKIVRATVASPRKAQGAYHRKTHSQIPTPAEKWATFHPLYWKTVVHFT